MDSFLQVLYKQYEDLVREKAHIDMNLAKIGELIILNKGTIPDSYRKPAMEKPIPAHEPTTVKQPVRNEQPMYNKELNWQDKITYTLKLMGKPVTAKQLAAKIRELEPGSEQSVEKSVELTTSRMSKAGIIGAKKDGVKNYYFLLTGAAASKQAPDTSLPDNEMDNRAL